MVLLEILAPLTWKESPAQHHLTAFSFSYIVIWHFHRLSVAKIQHHYEIVTRSSIHILNHFGLPGFFSLGLLVWAIGSGVLAPTSGSGADWPASACSAPAMTSKPFKHMTLSRRKAGESAAVASSPKHFKVSLTGVNHTLRNQITSNLWN